MNPKGAYGPLLTDLYQLTMAYGYWKQNRHDDEAVFHLFFRRAPFGEVAAITAGVDEAIDWVSGARFREGELDYLSGLVGNDGEPLFEGDFLHYLAEMDWAVSIEAIPEGELVYANEPMVRVRGPLLQCQLLETGLLNIINFQTLAATQAARLVEAAEGDPVLEFGLRRAQGPDGALSAARAAYIGGCVATSNVLAGQLYGIPVKGTHAHSWVMSYPTELDAFRAYAEALPNNAVFLVDTYDTEQGVANAITVGKEMRKRGYEMAGVRLDSGDLVELSKLARKMLDDAGFPEAAVVASNDLDVETIKTLKANGAEINVWGVGTKLATCYEQAALGGVYKLAAIRESGGEWDWKVKRSNDIIKVSNPGILQVRRDGGKDLIFHDPSAEAEGLLLPFIRNGGRLREAEALDDIREKAIAAWQTRTADYAVELDDTVMEMKRACLGRDPSEDPNDLNANMLVGAQ